MKNIYFILILFSLFSACHKPGDPPKDYIKFQMNGSWIECTYIPLASGPSQPNSLTLSGNWGTPPGGGSIFIILNNAISGNPITTGEYLFQLGNAHACLLYVDGKDYDVGTAGLTGGYWGSGRVRLTEINNEYVKGTFEMHAISITFPGNTKDQFNGEFRIKREM